MGFFDSWKISVHPTVSRTTFFPGNLVQGTLVVKAEKEVSFVGLRVHIVGQLFQKWQSGGKHKTTHTRRTTISKTSVTVAGQPENGSRAEMTLPPGEYVYAFAAPLPQNAPPSFRTAGASRVNALNYFVQAIADIKHGFDSEKQAPFAVLLPIPQQMWASPSAVTRQNDFDVTCCCCIDKGKVAAMTQMSKTIVALDRDQIGFSVAVDNSHGKEPVNAVEVFLDCTSTVNGIGRQMTITQTMYKNRFPCKIAPGQTQTVNGVLALGGLAPASFTSPTLAVTYKCRVSFDIPWASDPEASIPVVVAHSVEMTNPMPTPEQRFGTYQPMLAQDTAPNIVPNFATWAPQDPSLAPPPFANFASVENPPPLQPEATSLPGDFFAQQPPPPQFATCAEQLA